MIMGKIDDVERYDRFYDMTYDGIQNRMLPSILLPAGTLVVRGNDPKYDARLYNTPAKVATLMQMPWKWYNERKDEIDARVTRLLKG